MYLSYYISLLFSNVTSIQNGPSVSVYSTLHCANVCNKKEGCSFFYNQDTKSCISSFKNYSDKAQLSPAPGIQYYNMRRDCGAKWTLSDGHCYLLSSDSKSATDAQTACEELGGFLAKSDSTAINTIIASVTNYSRTWIGGSDKAQEGEWVWKDGSQVPLPPGGNWKPGEPNAHRHENCMELWVDQWNDVPCKMIKPYLCEK